MRHPVTLALLLALAAPAAGQGSMVEALGGEAAAASTTPVTQPALRWFKGNTHAHPRVLLPMPHGDSTPKQMARWYAERGYQFLCLSDHNRAGREARASSLVSDEFILISGSEISSDTRIRLIYRLKNRDAPERIVHTTALGIDPETFETKVWRGFTPASSVVDILRMHREATQDAGGLSILNHPNFREPITADEIVASGITHFEVRNAYPHSRDHGREGPSTEALWDQVLSLGHRLYGVASDDAHHTKEWNRKLKEKLGIRADPGGGWIMVRAAELTPAAITAAIQAGDFYATSGVVLSGLDVTSERLSVAVDMDATLAEVTKPYVFDPSEEVAAATGVPVEITFVTQDGAVLHTEQAASASVSLAGATGYVRARVRYEVVTGASARAFYAWTQPVFLD
jgi:hypothetical protein